jgi:hypothetical protein
MALNSIHKAVLHNDLHRVRRLLHLKKRGVDVQDTRGATPLMLACLMGSPKMVTLLLEKGASWAMKDMAGYSAVDYVRGHHADTMGATYRRFMRRSPPKSNRQRRLLRQHLKHVDVLKTQYRTPATGTLSFGRHGNTLRIHKLIAKVDVAGAMSQNTTTACIAAGNSLKPIMCAVSGWTATSTPGVLNGSKYTQLVRDMAAVLGFDLPRHCYDTPGGGSLPENVGRFNAVSLARSLQHKHD